MRDRSTRGKGTNKGIKRKEKECGGEGGERGQQRERKTGAGVLRGCVGVCVGGSVYLGPRARCRAPPTVLSRYLASSSRPTST